MIRELACLCVCFECAVPLIAGETWARGIDQVAMGTFWQHGHEVPGLALAMKSRSDQWPTLCLGGSDLSFGEVQLPGAGPVKGSRLSADWAASRHCFKNAGGAFELWVSNLSPAVLIQSDARQIVLFAGAAPTRIAAQPPDQPYLLVTFHHVKGFQDGQIPAVHGTPAIIGVDAPVLVILQNKPARTELSNQGLGLDFGDKPAGIVQVIPLFGVKKLKGEETAAWEKGVPTEVTLRCQRLARMSRFYPTSCREDYHLEADASLSVRQSFDYLEVKDEWGTPGEQAIPLPPALGIALTFGRKFSLPVSVRPDTAELPYFTPHGPLLICRGDHHTVRFEGARRYVDEVLEIRPGRDAASQEALTKLNTQAEAILRSARPFRYLASSSNYEFFRFGARNEQVFSLCQALPLLDETLRPRVGAHTKKMLEEYLVDMKYPVQVVATSAGRVETCTSPSSQSLGGTWEHEDLYNGLTLSAIWAYCHYTGDWDFARRRRPLLDRLASYLFVRHNWLLGFEVEGWTTTGFCLTAQVDALIAYARLMQGLGDEAACGQATYLVAKHLLGWYACFFGTDYLALYLGRDHTPGANRFRHLVNVLPEHLARKTDIIYDTKVTGWVTTHGPAPEGDPTLFLAPWTGIFPLAHDEMHRFWRDHLKGEIGVAWDFFTWLWPETFNQFSADQMNNWGGITPYYQLKAFVLDGSAEWLSESLPWPEVTQDPFYLQNLRAILFAAGETRWVPWPNAVTRSR